MEYAGFVALLVVLLVLLCMERRLAAGLLAARNGLAATHAALAEVRDRVDALPAAVAARLSGLQAPDLTGLQVAVAGVAQTMAGLPAAIIECLPASSQPSARYGFLQHLAVEGVDHAEQLSARASKQKLERWHHADKKANAQDYADKQAQSIGQPVTADERMAVGRLIEAELGRRNRTPKTD